MIAEASDQTGGEQAEVVNPGGGTPEEFEGTAVKRIRAWRRCKLCGRVRAVYRTFGICRHCWSTNWGRRPDAGCPEGEMVNATPEERDGRESSEFFLSVDSAPELIHVRTKRRSY